MSWAVDFWGIAELLDLDEARANRLTQAIEERARAVRCRTLGYTTASTEHVGGTNMIARGQ